MLSWRLKGQGACLLGLRSQALAPLQTEQESGPWQMDFWVEVLLEGVWGPESLVTQCHRQQPDPRLLRKADSLSQPRPAGPVAHSSSGGAFLEASWTLDGGFLRGEA